MILKVTTTYMVIALGKAVSERGVSIVTTATYTRRTPDHLGHGCPKRPTTITLDVELSLVNPGRSNLRLTRH